MAAPKTVFKGDGGEISRDKGSFSCKDQLAGYLAAGLLPLILFFFKCVMMFATVLISFFP